MNGIIEKFIKLFDPDDSFKPTAAQHNYVEQLLDSIHHQAVQGVAKNHIFIVPLDDPPANLEFPPGGLVEEIKYQTTGEGAKLELVKFEHPSRTISFVRKR